MTSLVPEKPQMVRSRCVVSSGVAVLPGDTAWALLLAPSLPVGVSLAEASEKRALGCYVTKAWGSHQDPASSVNYSEQCAWLTYPNR